MAPLLAFCAFIVAVMVAILTSIPLDALTAYLP